MDRREAIAALGGTAALILARGQALAEVDMDGGRTPSGSAAAFSARHAVVPLPFNPGKSKGLSERLLVSHHDNNYAAAVKSLNKVEEELAKVNKDTPGFVVSGLKERELTFTNSIILHEHYFGNLGGDGKPGGPIEEMLAETYGSLARWEEQFRALGGALGGGSGWAVLGYNFHANELRSYWSGHHTQGCVFGQPLLVLDMYEHAYQMDYGAAAAKYIDAFFQNIKWDEVNHRLERALKASVLLKG